MEAFWPQRSTFARPTPLAEMDRIEGIVSEVSGNLVATVDYGIVQHLIDGGGPAIGSEQEIVLAKRFSSSPLSYTLNAA
jgi:hypothetical protein